MRYSASGTAADQPEYPPPGATIDYYMAGEPDGEVTLEILNGKGVVVRSFVAQRSGAAAPPAAGRRGGASAPFTKRAWHNRFLWDLRHEGAFGSAGPLVVPGSYQVRLSVGEWSQARPLDVRIDPRVAAEGVTQADLQEQLDLSLKVRDAIDEARALAAKMTGARQSMRSDTAASKQLQALIGRVVTADIVYPQPMLIDQLSNVARMIGQADQKVGRDAFVRVDDLLKEMAAIKAELAKLGM
jgi:hypothetical protein